VKSVNAVPYYLEISNRDYVQFVLLQELCVLNIIMVYYFDSSVSFSM
jgi:hypothetical protein